MSAAHVKPWRVRYSLLTLLGVVTTICAALGLWVSRERAYQDRLAAVKMLSDVRVQRGRPDPDPLAGIELRHGARDVYDGTSYKQDSLHWADVVTYARVGGRPTEDLAAIGRLPTLRALEASGIFHQRQDYIGISDTQLSEIAKLRALEWLDLHDTQVTDEGITHLGVLRHLRELNLSQTSISGSGFAALSSLRELEKLDLHHSAFTDEGARDLSALSSVRVLNLTQTKIRDNGLRCLASMRKLEELELALTDVSDDGVRHLASLPSLRSLNLIGTKVCGEAFADFNSVGALESLSVGQTPFTDDSMWFLEAMRSLRFLDLSDTKVSDGGIVCLSSLARLEQLYLKGTDVGDASLHYLAGLRNLKCLSLANTRVTDEGIDMLRSLDSLHTVSLAECAISDAGLIRLGALKALYSVEVYGAPHVTAAGVAELRRLRPDVGVGWDGDSEENSLDEEAMGEQMGTGLNLSGEEQ